LRPDANDEEILDTPPADRDPCPIQEATIGWDGSPEVCELGTESGDEITLIRVTLRVGAPQGKPSTDDGLFNGFRKTARAMGPMWRTPKRGERVLVVFPNNDWETPGNAVVVGTIGASPSTRFGRKKTVLDFGTDDVVVTGKSVSIVSESTAQGASKASRHVVSVSERGGAQIISDGSGLFAKDGEVNVKAIDADGNMRVALLLAQDELSLIDATSLTNQGSITMKGGDITMLGSFMNIVPLSCLMIGQKATPATPMLVGPSGITGVPSTFIFAAVAP
jgi:phage baseplate assembly protein gpV